MDKNMNVLLSLMYDDGTQQSFFVKRVFQSTGRDMNKLYYILPDDDDNTINSIPLLILHWWAVDNSVIF